jgi:hypothetical protein
VCPSYSLAVALVLVVAFVLVAFVRMLVVAFVFREPFTRAAGR